MKKIDLVIWTLNSEETLPYTLNSIEKQIPKKHINQKIIVDGKSSDKTKEIAEFFGWNFISCKRGIGKQANKALFLVETEIFASFEHDIVLCDNWLLKIMDTIKPKRVAVSQGVRLSINPTLRAIEKYSLKRNLRYSSIDNTLYKTKIIKNLGGFPDYPVSCDRHLQDKIIENGFKWVINRNIISKHFKLGLRDTAKRINKLRLINDYPEHNRVLQNILRFLYSPIRGCQIAKNEKCFSAILGYLYWRFKRMECSFLIKIKKEK